MIKKVFVFGIFDILHQGHNRLFSFAKSLGDQLVVGLWNDGSQVSKVVLEQRLKSLRNNNYVDQTVVINKDLKDTLKLVNPDIVVQGLEYDDGVESSLTRYVNLSGARLVYWSDSSVHSHSIKKAADKTNFNYNQRNKITKKRLIKTFDKIRQMNGLIIGDIIVDSYVQSDIVGISQEDPTIVVRPKEEKIFLGGAGIIASHAASIANEVHLVSKLGSDQAAEFAKKKLEEYGISSKHLISQNEFKTPLKTRYITGTKTQLRVNQFDDFIINKKQTSAVLDYISSIESSLDFIIFSDFTFGTISDGLIRAVIKYGNEKNIFMSADSQVSSKIGNILKFQGVNYICPTEFEARVSLKNNHGNIRELANQLVKETGCSSCILTLGSDGVFVFSNMKIGNSKATDTIPSLSNAPIDVAGAGDSFLIASTVALAAGEDIWMAAYIGSLAAKAQVERFGNTPMSLDDFGILNNVN